MKVGLGTISDANESARSEVQPVSSQCQYMLRSDCKGECRSLKNRATNASTAGFGGNASSKSSFPIGLEKPQKRLGP